jgi:hypothetical protein
VTTPDEPDGIAARSSARFRRHAAGVVVITALQPRGTPVDLGRGTPPHRVAGRRSTARHLQHGTGSPVLGRQPPARTGWPSIHGARTRHPRNGRGRPRAALRGRPLAPGHGLLTEGVTSWMVGRVVETSPWRTTSWPCMVQISEGALGEPDAAALSRAHLPGNQGPGFLQSALTPPA